LGNFAQYVLPLLAQNGKGENLKIQKISKDRWQVSHPENESEIQISYQYCCSVKNAGGTFKSENQLIITPVNCLVYPEHLIAEKCHIELQIPVNFAKKSSIKNGVCENYYQLAASPIVCGTRICEEIYRVNETNFHVIFEGNVKPDFDKIIADFKGFTEAQIEVFGDFPSADYYFLNLIFDEKHYHGVEHLDSTLIALGPNTEFEMPDFYLNLLGISSHELFHYWNICRIRPVELMPYNYTGEQYFETGYIAEGVTTYYGDLMLAKSKVVSQEVFLELLGDTLNRHLSNPARDSVSVSDSSMDLWLDGYKQGVSGRKVSIYHKGAAIAFILDLWIRKETKGVKSLDDVMRLMWENHGKTGIGYTSSDYKNYIEQVTQASATWYFDDYVYGVKAVEEILNELLLDYGLTLKLQTIADKNEWKLSRLENIEEWQMENLNLLL
jgi:predicted metalloprotease with PDZ domain